MLEFILSVCAAIGGNAAALRHAGEVYAERSGAQPGRGRHDDQALCPLAIAQTTGNVWLGILAAALVGGLLP